MRYCEVAINVSSVQGGWEECSVTYIPTMTSSSTLVEEFRFRTWSATIEDAALSLARENF